RRLSRDGSPGGGAAPAHGPTPAVKERDRHTAFTGEARQLDMRFRELPVRREETAVLVGVGIADHDLVDATLGPHAATHQRYLKELPNDVRCALQIFDRLE